jgi:hypothetical protein
MNDELGNLFGMLLVIAFVLFIGYGIIKYIEQNQAYIFTFFIGLGIALVVNAIISATLKKNESAQNVAYAIYWSGAFLSAVIMLVKTELISLSVAAGSLSWVGIAFMLK